LPNVYDLNSDPFERMTGLGPAGGSLGDDGVGQATRTARRVVLWSFVAAAALAMVLTAERWFTQDAVERRIEEVKTAARLADTILLEDERLTMSAMLAANTGQPRWVARYEERLPAIDAAIAQATTMASPQAAQSFDKATRVANDKLVLMERQAFAHVAAQDLAGARAVLDSSAYAKQKAVLADGTDAFMADLQRSAQQRLQALTLRSWALVVALLAISGLAFALLWRTLNLHLARAERAFDAKRAEVNRLALHDALTGLPNRRNLHLQLAGSVARAQRDGGRFAVLMIDLDGFKPINDRYGHHAGDAVLLAVSERLAAQVRKGEIAARLGGDEFVVVLAEQGAQAADGQGKNADPAGPAEPADAQAPSRVAQRLIAALAEGILLPEAEVRVSASVGVAYFPADATTPDDLLRKADVALYRAKHEGRGEVRFFQPSMDDEARQRDALVLDLRNAIAEQHIEPYFQALIDLPSGALTGFEVLARWQHPSRGAIPPTVFVPIAEATGQIDALTVCIMRQALSVARDWDPSLSIAVNIAPQQLKSETLVERLLAVLRETGFPAQRFEVEITENALIADLDLARRIVLDLKRHGIRVALDDFGTGYSSLNHLSELPFDKIKIDRSFVHTMHERPESATIVNAIIGLGRSLNLPTTAEGIESQADADLLMRLGCTVGQGFLYSKPVPAAQAVLLANGSLLRTASTVEGVQ
jgi:predicted signal transduction protein with EAL and GGDEF domain